VTPHQQGQGQGRQASLGAHEVMEIHEILSGAINAVNSFDLYRPHIKDPQLRDIVSRHRDFAIQEYNSMVNSLQQRGVQPAPMFGYIGESSFSPKYGLRNPSPERPGGSIDDKGIASGVLGIHKCSATKRMTAAVECADPQVRQSIIQGAINCADQAFEVFQYMNQRGWYQVPTMQPNTTQTVLGHYQPTQGGPSPSPGFDLRQPVGPVPVEARRQPGTVPAGIPRGGRP